ncbi:hypothetical protein BofuT4_P141360.1 [Botrytis cinerea T4]|uniref:Uncharacterized protein n=1 Tax=Botryotinia fuckeliana (strain T4) TaxID=999810 RepID=G2YZ26_BOTF4|nr:hypothetical protein BofuT4_P141360.1 [Botrytis cinerea T4]
MSFVVTLNFLRQKLQIDHRGWNNVIFRLGDIWFYCPLLFRPQFSCTCVVMMTDYPTKPTNDRVCMAVRSYIVTTVLYSLTSRVLKPLAPPPPPRPFKIDLREDA